ncbi:hypothetical protein PHLGIDRAFT_17540 [Phlebiopsis gigantea 11061_1 CR5-6]|uniref:Ubiquitin carboxyl-terminal hydrolase n=1 Tax=Phlebiopsis gigantea (strain 11061_1 CR5-6) TaxID=745531 RepID=A0A0C3S876_PHLG1|nr:hypothetical protein PHLGIDRAFT_17540 [Phlebiopsis gigantea 11061_1 CR5-6]
MPSTVKNGKFYRQTFFPLEANPVVFNEVMQGLGVASSLTFVDVLSIDDPDVLAWVPRPALALVMVCPDSPAYKAKRRELDSQKGEYTGKGGEEPAIWWRQTIYNACGLYGLLHAVTNDPARRYIQKGSILDGLLERGILLAPEERALVLEGSPELEKIHTAAALKGDTAPPEHEDDEVDGHYICFVRSQKDGHVYLLDGDRKGPLDLGIALKEGEDMLSEGALEAVRSQIRLEDGANVNFNLMALVEAQD